MSSYSTVRPGMESDDNHTLINQEPESFSTGSYHDGPSPTSQTIASSAGTRIPGMNEVNNTQNVMPGMMHASTSVSNGKPVVGFLVSVSKTEEVEYWVLHQGQNIIGSSSECDIVLSESLISGTHAVLAIHRNPNEGNKLNVGIIDRGSSNGTFVNKNYIGFNPYQCSNLDKISIGNYEMLLMLFDYVEYGMTKSDKFQATDVVMPASQPQASGVAYDYANRDAYPSSGADSTKY